MTRAFVSARTVARFGALADTARPHTAVRYPAVSTYTDGQDTLSWPIAAESYDCRLVPIGDPRAVSVADSPKVGTEWTLCVPPEATVEARDRFTVSGTDRAGQLWTRTVDVLGTPGPHSHEAERLVRCTLVS